LFGCDENAGFYFLENYNKHLILVYCSNGEKISAGEVRKFGKIVAKYPQETLGIFVTTSTENEYSENASKLVNSSNYNILITIF
ncbi:3662_t:CDS:1, partial [Cetraspora pellucida]